MFSIKVTHEFCAAHSIILLGKPEPIHGHNFKTTATITGTSGENSLDNEGLLCDFHLVEKTLIQICDPFTNNNFNETPPFNTLNPTAENIAKHIADQLAAKLDATLAPRAKVHSVSITEAPNCLATYTRP
ncbi:MAG: 6-carboxytetrahydropterin synthase [Gammaproteobacteria bacterium]|nr:6-carboxytetrahydropterin synthase [Gammaproteobacteria bacterium]